VYVCVCVCVCVLERETERERERERDRDRDRDRSFGVLNEKILTFFSGENHLTCDDSDSLDCIFGCRTWPDDGMDMQPTTDGSFSIVLISGFFRVLGIKLKATPEHQIGRAHFDRIWPDGSDHGR
jgi:hypothetical protein